MAQKQQSSFPPSKMERVLSCAGSFALEASVPFKGGQKKFVTDEGSVAHQLAEWCLTDGKFDTRAYLGKTIRVFQNKGTPRETSFEMEVKEDMCRDVQIYVDNVKSRLRKFQAQKNVKDVTLQVEKRLNTSGAIGIPNQSGIADTLLIVHYKDGTTFVSVEDLKYGKGVPVVADKNAQLMTYGAAVLDSLDKKIKVKKVDLVIHMPRLGYVSTASVTPAQLNAFSKKLKKGVTKAIDQQEVLKTKGAEALDLTPGTEQCRFCKAKSICPAFNKAGSKDSKPTAPANQNPAPAVKNPPSRKAS
jgi:hypothetical protein